MQLWYAKMLFSTSIWLHHMLSTLWPVSVVHTAALDRGKLVTLITGKGRHLLVAVDDDEVFMTRRLNIMPKTAEQK